MRKTSLILLLVISIGANICSSCVNEKKEKNAMSKVNFEGIEHKAQNMYDVIETQYYFIPISKDSIIVVEAYSLWNYYVLERKNNASTFRMYFNDILSQKENINNINLDAIDTYRISKRVTAMYKKGGYKMILSRYCKHDSNKNIYVVSSDLSFIEQISVIYYMSKHAFVCHRDDLTGYLIISKQKTHQLYD